MLKLHTKDVPDKVLEAFSNYLKPERNVFHSWYTLGSIYSNQFKSQSDFYNCLQCVAKECNFSARDEIMKSLFLTHNNNTSYMWGSSQGDEGRYHIGNNGQHSSCVWGEPFTVRNFPNSTLKQLRSVTNR